jgi:hypothetical protein
MSPAVTLPEEARATRLLARELCSASFIAFELRNLSVGDFGRLL